MKHLGIALVAAVLLVGCDGTSSDGGATSVAQSEGRDQASECARHADPEACDLRTRREALRACARSPQEPPCTYIDDATVLTPKLIEACVERSDGTVIESFGRRAIRRGNIAEADVRELLRVCRKGTI